VIDLALADAPLPLLLFSLAELAAGSGHLGGADGVLGGAAAYNAVYRTADGKHVVLAAIEPKFWAAFCQAAGRPDWLSRQSDPLPQTALTAELAAMFAALRYDHAIARFAPADCCFAAVAPFADAIRSPQAAARGLLPVGEDGVTQALFPALVDGEPPERRAPLREM